MGLPTSSEEANVPPPSLFNEKAGIGFEATAVSAVFVVFFASLPVAQAANKSANNNFFIQNLLGIEERSHRASSAS
jgi:hypothetical protein